MKPGGRLLFQADADDVVALPLARLAQDRLVAVVVLGGVEDGLRCPGSPSR